MKLFGKDVTPEKVMTYVAERLEARGLARPADLDVPSAGVEPRVDPLSFTLSALEANADATRGLPLETHRDGVGGQAVLLAKRVFRAAGQIFINEALGRQRVFNGHVRDSYAQLASEVMRLRARVAELEARPPVVATSPGELRAGDAQAAARRRASAGEGAPGGSTRQVGSKVAARAKSATAPRGGATRAVDPGASASTHGSRTGQPKVAEARSVSVAVVGEARPEAPAKKTQPRARPGTRGR